MGRASRKKKERKESQRDLNSSNMVNQYGYLYSKNYSVAFPENKIERTFRFFDLEEYAESFLKGTMRISTLSCCRKFEDPLQGDAGEAVHTHSISRMVGGGNDLGFMRGMQSAGFYVDPDARNVTISDVDVVHKIPDAFLLCTTENYNPNELAKTFGKYCVEIFDPISFHKVVTEELSKITVLSESVFGRVKYKNRISFNADEAPGILGFVKPSKYAPQSEVRHLWIPSGDTTLLEPFLINVPAAAQYCRRII